MHASVGPSIINLLTITSGPLPTEFLTSYRLYADLDERLLLYGRPECGFAYKWLASMGKHRLSALLCQRLTYSDQHLCPDTICDTWIVYHRSDDSSAHSHS